MKTYVHMLSMFSFHKIIATLFIRAPNWKQLICPSVGEWIKKKFWHILWKSYTSPVKHTEQHREEVEIVFFYLDYLPSFFFLIKWIKYSEHPCSHPRKYIFLTPQPTLDVIVALIFTNLAKVAYYFNAALITM